MLLKEMKDLKRNYKDNYDKLKNMKTDSADVQRDIDMVKGQLIVNFEQWYSENFESSNDPNNILDNQDENY